MEENITVVMEDAGELDVFVDVIGEIDGKQLNDSNKEKLSKKLSFGQENEEDRKKKIESSGSNC